MNEDSAYSGGLGDELFYIRRPSPEKYELQKRAALKSGIVLGRFSFVIVMFSFAMHIQKPTVVNYAIALFISILVAALVTCVTYFSVKLNSPDRPLSKREIQRQGNLNS